MNPAEGAAAGARGREGQALRASDMPLPGGNFRLFVQKLNYQALIALGVLENPLTGSRERNLGSARGLLDDLAMLREKTMGNLDLDEREHLERVLRDLEHQFERARV